MEDKEMQNQFIQWLAKKTGVKSEEELKQVLVKLQSNKEQLNQMVQEFKTEIGGEQPQPQFKTGGKLAYLNCLEKFKKGGKVDCGCGGVKMEKGAKVPKAFLGAALGAMKGAGAILKGGTSAVKGAQTLANVAKGANFGLKALSVGKQIAGGMKPGMTTQTKNVLGDTATMSVPNMNTPTQPTFQVGMMNSPNDIPGGQVLYPPTMNQQVNTQPRIVEKGAKLKAKVGKKK